MWAAPLKILSGNARNGARAKMVITDIGAVQIEVPATGLGLSSR
jgi:hypothetical protein